MTASQVRQLVKRIILNKVDKELTFLELCCAIFDKSFADLQLARSSGDEEARQELAAHLEEADAILAKHRPLKVPALPHRSSDPKAAAAGASRDPASAADCTAPVGRVRIRVCADVRRPLLSAARLACRRPLG